MERVVLDEMAGIVCMGYLVGCKADEADFFA